MTTVTLDNITKVYGSNVLAVDNVSIDIKDGEFLTLVGPSGSGKSTILRMLAGIVDITDGQLSFNEHDVTDVSPQQRDVAMVFQDYALYPNMTVRENMEFGLKMQGFPADERREMVEDAAETLQIQSLLDRDIQQLSGGQQQRVALGRSIVREPAVFLLDEPLANLDAKLRVEMRTTLVELQRQLDITTVYVTHNQLEAMTMSDRVAVVDSGEIQQLDEPQELFRNPANKFVADFIGTPTMNFLDAGIERDTTPSVKTRAFEIKLTEEHDLSERLRTEYSNLESCTLGIRPQHISLVGVDEDAEGVFEAEVAIVETAGDELIIHLDVQDARITSVVEEDVDIEHGDIVTARVDPEKIHLFEPESGDSIS